jgi:hypothetical protein
METTEIYGHIVQVDSGNHRHLGFHTLLQHYTQIYGIKAVIFMNPSLCGNFFIVHNDSICRPAVKPKKAKVGKANRGGLCPVPMSI